MRYLSIVFIFSLLSGCASNANSKAEAVPPTTANTSVTRSAEPDLQEAKDTEYRLICRNEKVTGSNKRVRSCRKVSGT